LQSDNKALGYLDSCGQWIEYDHYKKNLKNLVNDQGQSKGGHLFLLLFVPISLVIYKSFGNLGNINGTNLKVLCCQKKA